MNHEHTARTALSMAGISPADQAAIVAQLIRRLDRADALARRDYHLRIAHSLVGSVAILTSALHRWHATAWPCHRHRADPPPELSTLHTCFFRISQAAADAGSNIPGPRQIRRIVD